MLKLEAVYQGKNWSVYHLPEYLAEVFPKKSEKEILEEGYLRWEPGCPYPPSVSYDGSPYGKEGVASFLPVVDQCPPGCKEFVFYRPTQGQLYFRVEYIDVAINLDRGTLYVPLEYLFERPANDEKPDIVVETTKLPELLAELDRRDVQLTAVAPAYRSYSSFVNVWTDRGIPYELYWRLGYVSPLALEKMTIAAEPSLPLFLKQRGASDEPTFHLRTQEGLYYAFRNTCMLTAEQVKEICGFDCNQPATVTIGAFSSRRDPYCLPIEIIARVKAKEPLKLIWNLGSDLVLRLQPETCDELVLHSPRLVEDNRFGLVNAPEHGLTEMLADRKLVKLNKKLLAGGRDYTLYYVSQGTLHRLPGKYARAGLTYRGSSLTKKEKKEYESVCSTLTYLLPGKASYWSIDDLKRYDALLRSGRYAKECVVSAGSRQWTIRDEGAKQLWLQQNRYVTFTPLVRRPAVPEAVLWEVIPLAELLTWLNDHIQEQPNESEVQKVLFYLASKKVNPQALIEGLSVYYGLSAVETALISAHVTTQTKTN